MHDGRLSQLRRTHSVKERCRDDGAEEAAQVAVRSSTCREGKQHDRPTDMMRRACAPALERHSRQQVPRRKVVHRSMHPGIHGPRGSVSFAHGFTLTQSKRKHTLLKHITSEPHSRGVYVRLWVAPRKTHCEFASTNIHYHKTKIEPYPDMKRFHRACARASNGFRVFRTLLLQ